MSKLKGMFGASPATRPAPVALPDGERVYAIGDIHGRYDLLTDLLERIDADDAARGDARTRIIFLGDLVDRGPDSASVVELLATRDFGERQVDFLLGNHEEVFLKALGGNLETMRFWLRIGGEETLLSYGTPIELIDRGLADELVEDFLPRVPSHHIAFLHAMTDMVRIGDYCFVHAGVKPHVPIDRQKPEDLRWIREQFLNFEGN
ncbi:MAG: metallophosphoesterase, partial [Sphingomonas sp.]